MEKLRRLRSLERQGGHTAEKDKIIVLLEKEEKEHKMPRPSADNPEYVKVVQDHAAAEASRLLQEIRCVAEVRLRLFELQRSLGKFFFHFSSGSLLNSISSLSRGSQSEECQAL
jgi:hypothetical protein